MLRQILCLLLLAAFAVDGNAQDPIFSQFYSAPLMLNPAFAGNTYEPRIAMNYRNQFPAVVDGSTAFATYAVSYEQFVPSLNSGVGLLIKTDNAGGVPSFHRSNPIRRHVVKIQMCWHLLL